MNNRVVQIVLPQHIYNELKKNAKRTNRTAGAMAGFIVKKWVERKMVKEEAKK